jgi:MADS-box transcription factor
VATANSGGPVDSVHSTFLKRKGGLFKKAHELSVLCSVDVAVIIFGHNKKLYEFSSGDIRETLGKYQYVSPPLPS